MNFMNRPNYIEWIIEEQGVVFNDGIPLNSYKITYDISDEETLNQWALHIRRHYIQDNELEESLKDLPCSKEEYLKHTKSHKEVVRVQYPDRRISQKYLLQICYSSL